MLMQYLSASVACLAALLRLKQLSPKTNRNYPPLGDKVLFNFRHDSLMTGLKLLAVSREN